ncbi:MAG: hypothetical protein PHC40_03655 [Eubacteriales bacterium]|nr:hypothetical protein [Eubacteriales bacterium]
MDDLKEKRNTEGLYIGMGEPDEEPLTFEYLQKSLTSNSLLGRPGEGKGFFSNYLLAQLGPGRRIHVREGFRLCPFIRPSLPKPKNKDRMGCIYGAYKSQKKRVYRKFHNFTVLARCHDLLYGNPRGGMTTDFEVSGSGLILGTLGPGRGFRVRKGFRLSLYGGRTNRNRIRLIFGAYKSKKKRVYQKLHDFPALIQYHKVED